MNFVYKSQPAHAVFGVGNAGSISKYLDIVGARRVLFVCTKSGAVRYRSVRERIGEREIALFDGVQSHCPQPVVDLAVGTCKASGADTVIAVGGGSTLGIGKILKAEHGMKFIAVPTTYSGSEMTPIYGRKVDGQKSTRVDAAAIPDMAIYDPELTRDLPSHQTAATGMNSLAHAVEALYPAEPNPIAFELATKAIQLHGRALPAAIADPGDIGARTDALYAGFLGGLLVSMVGVALHHALGHVLGGLFELEHGDYNSVVLPHVMAYNATAAPDAADAVCSALGAEDPGVALFELAQSINAPTSLAALGMPEEGVERAAAAIVKKAPRNPRSIDMEAMVKLLGAAHAGVKPSVSDYV